GTQENPITDRAELVIREMPLKDIEQLSGGIVCFGRCRMQGMVKTPFVRLAKEPRAGNRQLWFSEPVRGWHVGDRLILPDSSTQANQRAIEDCEVARISQDGMLVELKKPISFDHLGARDRSGQLRFLPHVANCPRNVMVRSANPSGTRGH